MPRPKLPRSVTYPGLVEVARGATFAEAAARAGVGLNTLRRRAGEEPMVVLRDRVPRQSDLSMEERVEIQIGIDRGESDANIAARLGRHRSSIWREISRNGGRHCYAAIRSQGRADECARRPKDRWFIERSWLWDHIVELLHESRWSPEQIAHRLRLDHHDDPQWWVSHEAIYQALFVQAKGELRKELLSCLRSGRVRRRPQSRAARTGSRIVGMVNI